jgi:hypothetical protein
LGWDIVLEIGVYVNMLEIIGSKKLAEPFGSLQLCAVESIIIVKG